MCDKRYSLPSDLTVENYGNYRLFSKSKMFKKPADMQERLDAAPCENDLFRVLCEWFGKAFGFYCFGLDVLVDERDGSYNLIDFNAMPGYGKNQGMNDALNTFVQNFLKNKA